MAQAARSLRSSGRNRTQRKRYTDDAFEGLDILNGTDSEKEQRPRIVDEDEADEDFTVRKNVEEGNEAKDDLSVGDAVESCAPEDDGSDAGDALIDEEDSIVGSEEDNNPSSRSVAKTFPSRKRRDKRSEPRSEHTRGLHDLKHHHGAKKERQTSTFGSGQEDIEPILQTRRKWYDEPTLPSREADAEGVGGLANSYFFTKKMRNREAVVSCNWYFEDRGRDFFTKRQKLTHLDQVEASKYMPRCTHNSHSVLLGPYNNQKLCSLDVGSSMNVRDAGAESQTAGSKISGSQSTHRDAWLLNVGSKIQSMEWVPNEGGSAQYLAISVLPASFHKPFDSPAAPAFTPYLPSPASLQIFELAPKRKSGQACTIDFSQSPRLRIVICTDWGDVKHFTFGYGHKYVAAQNMSDHDEASLGLLAAIWADGKLRVLDIPRPSHAETGTAFILIEQAAFEASLPNTVGTCLRWISPTDVAVGHANGVVAIYSISQFIKSSSCSTSDNPAPVRTPRPWFHACVSPTYILALTSAYPSRPHLLLTSSASGHIRLTDIRAPYTDTVLSQRSRIGSSVLQWSDHIQSAISADDNYNLRAYPARRFFSYFALARLPSTVTSLAVSNVHPFILAGTADGGLYATNPIRRMLDARVPSFQQLLFQHEWSRLNPRFPPPAGISRMTEGYKAEQALGVSKKTGVKSSKALGGKTSMGDGGVFATVYEEKSAVTACAWNQSLHVGGWAAIGTGCGLIRVQDLAI